MSWHSSSRSQPTLFPNKPWAAVIAASALMLLAGTVQAAGFKKVSIPSAGPHKALEVTLWTPCAQAVQSPLPAGPFQLKVKPGCPIFNHPGDNAFDPSQSDDLTALYQRPAHIKHVIDFLLGNTSPVAQRINAHRIGFWGFSRGGLYRPGTGRRHARICQQPTALPRRKNENLPPNRYAPNRYHCTGARPAHSGPGAGGSAELFPHPKQRAAGETAHSNMAITARWRWRHAPKRAAACAQSAQQAGTGRAHPHQPLFFHPPLHARAGSDGKSHLHPRRGGL